MVRSLAIAVSLLACQAAAHTFIWAMQGVYVNGIDQGTGKGIRTPAYNGAPGKGGYNNGPVKDLTSIDLRCNVMGDIQTSETIKVMPGDNLTFDCSPDPPTPSSFIKLWHSGKTSLPFPQPGLWSTTSDIRAHYGHMNMRIPAALKPGPYLIRAEMIALHEGDVSYIANPRRGAQFYPDCVQIEVVGDGDVALPSDGVGFPGAYGYGDEGVVHNVFTSLPFYALNIRLLTEDEGLLLHRNPPLRKRPPRLASRTTLSLGQLCGAVHGRARQVSVWVRRRE
ncbi:hypothetical protein SNOG_05441 [Parastagonospora nodorum SN15]|uniref:AA9 family lytic polysaccharide monooxygenase n=1 Tax=Phaeosphaeria nodorum (strain SN15 / ATCC MYA-4574 / FGSC 10173) TaxID=321614 RepID=Q0US23_PHANO|nr:hypothetical protein SNOG_05441 [Parastagonospora nodorum SN15]EAT87832.2 hypothetical protein SNOG_05441 [Parastagonospora nodorum SN15]